MSLEEGSLSVNGSLALVSQQTWIFNGTIRDNILMGSQFDSAWYQEVIQACALASDLKVELGGVRYINLNILLSCSVKEIKLRLVSEESLYLEVRSRESILQEPCMLIWTSIFLMILSLLWMLRWVSTSSISISR